MLMPKPLPNAQGQRALYSPPVPQQLLHLGPPKGGFSNHSPLPTVTPSQLCQSYVLPLPSTRGLSVGQRPVAWPGPLPPASSWQS